MTNKIYDYNTPADFTYDSDKIEVSGGLAKLKDLTPVDETFYANYNADINGNRGLGDLAGVAHGGASVNGGKLDCKVWGKYVDYDAVNNAGSQQQGCIRFQITPDFTGIGNKHRFFAIYHQNGVYNNFIRIMQWHNGQITIVIYDQNAVVIVNDYIDVWSPTQGQQYEFELNWDITLGETRFFIDGIQSGGTLIGTGIRNSNINILKVGGDFQSFCSNSEFDNVQIFSTVQHTADYTLISPPETIYDTNKPTIEPTDLFDPHHTASWDSFLETLGGDNLGSIGYNLYKVDKTNKYFWDGILWAAGGDSSNYNAAAVVGANINAFDISPDKIGFIAYLISTGEQKVELDENQVSYTPDVLALPTYIFKRIAPKKNKAITKQSWEKFIIAGDFVDQATTGEFAVLVGSSVLAEDKDGLDVSTVFLDQTTKTVDGTQLQIKLRAGAEGSSPYKITFRILTSLDNNWEIDVKCKVKEL